MVMEWTMKSAFLLSFFKYIIPSPYFNLKLFDYISVSKDIQIY